MKLANRWGCNTHTHTHTQVYVSNRITISNITENVMLFVIGKNINNINMEYIRTIEGM